eukprot:scaffold35145_cov33-Phaeocystis_antarctica.AAC.1
MASRVTSCSTPGCSSTASMARRHLTSGGSRAPSAGARRPSRGGRRRSLTGSTRRPSPPTASC